MKTLFSDGTYSCNCTSFESWLEKTNLELITLSRILVMGRRGMKKETDFKLKFDHFQSPALLLKFTCHLQPAGNQQVTWPTGEANQILKILVAAKIGVVLFFLRSQIVLVIPAGL